MRLAATRSSISAGSTGPPEAGAGAEELMGIGLRREPRGAAGPASWASLAGWQPSWLRRLWDGQCPRAGPYSGESGAGRRGGMNFTNFLNLEGFSFPGFDPVTGTVTLPWWAVAVVAALLVASWLLAVLRGGPAILVGSFVGVAFLALAVTIAWVGSERAAERERVAERERTEERQVLSARAQDLAREAA